MDSNYKHTKDDADNFAFVVGGATFSNICESNVAIWYILGLEVSLQADFHQFWVLVRWLTLDIRQHVGYVQPPVPEPPLPLMLE